MVAALAFQQCVQGSIPGSGVTSGLSLLVLYSVPRGFYSGFPLSLKTITCDHLSSSRTITDFNKVMKCLVVHL